MVGKPSGPGALRPSIDEMTLCIYVCEGVAIRIVLISSVITREKVLFGISDGVSSSAERIF